MSQPQLVMWYRDLTDLPPVELPGGYALRTLQDGEEESWAQLLNRNGQLGEWSLERAKQALRSGVVGEHVYFITFGGQPVATACVDLQGASPGEFAAVGWVAVDPSHQGKRLGYQITLAALYGVRSLGYKAAFLLTDDFRLPAVKTYLNLGFEPDLSHESYPARWEALQEKLAG